MLIEGGGGGGFPKQETTVSRCHSLLESRVLIVIVSSKSIKVHMHPSEMCCYMYTILLGVTKVTDNAQICGYSLR